jgi:hypothetical protein
MLKYLIIIFLFLNTLVSFSQSLTGTVTDTLNNPLESANVIAKSLQEKISLKFIIIANKNIIYLES